MVAAAVFAGVWLIWWALSALIVQQRQQRSPKDRSSSSQPQHSQEHGYHTTDLHEQRADRSLDYEDTDHIAERRGEELPADPLELVMQRRPKKKTKKASSDNFDPPDRLVPKSDGSNRNERVLKGLDGGLLPDQNPGDVVGEQMAKVRSETTNRTNPNTAPSFDVVFTNIHGTARSNIHLMNGDTVVLLPQEMDPTALQDRFWMEFGGLNLDFFEDEDSTRQIKRDYELLQTDFRDYNAKETTKDDGVDTYYAFDDDMLRNEFIKDRLEEEQGASCRRVAEHRLNFQNCNTFHETPLLESHVQYIA
jgi:hypothetical protein